MLNALRNAARGTTAKVLLGLLIASFAVWGVSGAFTTRAQNTVIAAGETTVDLNEYALAYTRAVNEFGARLGARLTAEQAQALGVEQVVISELLASAVLDEQARDLQLGVSEDELAQLVADDPAFQGLDGRFDRSRFRSILRQVGIAEEEYLRTRAAVARRLQLVDTVAGEVEAPEAFRTARAELDAQSRDISFIRLTEDIVPVADAPTEEELTAFFEANEANYQRPEFRSVRYAVLSPETIADPEAIADETVRAAYDADPERYRVPASRDVQRLVFPTREDADAAVTRLEAGEVTFEELIAERGVDARSIVIPGATEGTYPDADAVDAVFALGLNEVGEPYDTRFGTVLARPTRVFEETTRSFENVSDELRQEIAENEANALIGEALDAYTDERAGGATIEEAVAAQGLELATIEAIDARGVDPAGEEVDVPLPSLVTAAFEAEPNEETDPLPIPGGGFVLFEVSGTQPARPFSFDEVRERVVADFEADRTAAALGTRAAKLDTALRDGQTLEEVATELGLEIQREFAVRRRAGDPARTTAIFGGPKGYTALAPVDEGYDLIRVDTVASDAEPAESAADPIADDILQQLVARLQRDYQPTYNAAAAERARTR